jgi:hypothetical protein
MSDSAQKSPQILQVAEWESSSLKFMPYKKNERGGGAVNIISSQMNKALRIETPLMMTFGISDYVDEKTGESDGRFNLTLNFPNDEYSNEDTTSLLEKMKKFEEYLLDSAVTNSETWFGKKLTRELVEDRFFSVIKYRKNKETGGPDYEKPPAIKIRVPCYEGNWNIKLYDTNAQCVFPSSDSDVSPLDLVPKYSQIACVVQCGGLWFGGKGWGVTWRLNQAVVKPRGNSGFDNDICHLKLSDEDKSKINSYESPETDEVEDVKEEKDDVVEDSDEEVEKEEPVPKKVVKKVVSEPVDTAVEEAAPKKKKVLKKKA